MRIIVIKYGYIGRTELQTKCGKMSVSKYNKLKPYFEEEVEGVIAYDKARKIWYHLTPEDNKVKSELIEMELISE